MKSTGIGYRALAFAAGRAFVIAAVTVAIGNVTGIRAADVSLPGTGRTSARQATGSTIASRRLAQRPPSTWDGQRDGRSPRRTTPNVNQQRHITTLRRTKDGRWVTERVPIGPPPNQADRIYHSVPAPRHRVVRYGSGSSGGAGFAIGAIVFTAVLVLALIFGSKRHAQTIDAYSRLAKKYGGTCNANGWFGSPKVYFARDGSHVLIDIHSTGGEHATYYTQVHCSGGQPDIRCEVYPEKTLSRIGKFLGIEDVEIGSAFFDERYIIKGATAAAMRELLNSAVQMQIEQLRRFLGNDNIYVSINRRELLVKKLSYIRDYHQLVKFTELSLGLFDQITHVSEQGIEFVEPAHEFEATDAICQICGDPITSDMVICRRCKTPHHLDCWKYYGSCSTYGCGERRYLVPKHTRGKRGAKT